MIWTTLLLGAGLAALAMNIWSALCWMVLPHHRGDFWQIDDKEDLETCLRRLDLRPGFYVLPHMDDYEQGQTDPALHARMNEGPNVFFTVMPNRNPMTGMTFVRGFLINLLEGLLLAVLYTGFAAQLSSLMAVLAAGAGIGGAFGLIHYGIQSNWMSAPWRFCWTNTFDRSVGYALMALVLYFVGPAVT